MNESLDVQWPQSSVSVTRHDTVVVGAGPYGLSTAAYVFEQGPNVAIFGKPLSLWRGRMPKGLLLRSYWWATNISDPHKQYSLERYFRENCQQAIDPLPATTGFVPNLSRWIGRRFSSKGKLGGRVREGVEQ